MIHSAKFYRGKPPVQHYFFLLDSGLANLNSDRTPSFYTSVTMCETFVETFLPKDPQRVSLQAYLSFTPIHNHKCIYLQIRRSFIGIIAIYDLIHVGMQGNVLEDVLARAFTLKYLRELSKKEPWYCRLRYLLTGVTDLYLVLSEKAIPELEP